MQQHYPRQSWYKKLFAVYHYCSISGIDRSGGTIFYVLMHSKSKFNSHNWFYASQLNASSGQLTAEELHHATAVLRMKPGERICLFNGLGALGQGKLKTNGLVQIECFEQHVRNGARISIAVGIPDKSRFELFLSQAGSFGIEQIFPIVCDHCDIPWWSKRWEKQALKFERILLNSAKQAHNTFVATITPPQHLKRFLQSFQSTFLCADQGHHPALTELLLKAPKNNTKITNIVGPPGGLSPAESTVLADHGVQFYSMGRYRLRTELAASLSSWILSTLCTDITAQPGSVH